MSDKKPPNTTWKGLALGQEKAGKFSLKQKRKNEKRKEGVELWFEEKVGCLGLKKGRAVDKERGGNQRRGGSVQFWFGTLRVLEGFTILF